MPRKYDPMNPFRYKVMFKDELIKVTMIYKSKVIKIKKEFSLCIDDWMQIKRFIGTPYNTHSMKYRLLTSHIDPLFSEEERLYPEYMEICMDAGKAIDQEYERSN